MQTPSHAPSECLVAKPHGKHEDTGSLRLCFTCLHNPFTSIRQSALVPATHSSQDEAVTQMGVTQLKGNLQLSTQLINLLCLN